MYLESSLKMSIKEIMSLLFYFLIMYRIALLEGCYSSANPDQIFPRTMQKAICTPAGVLGMITAHMWTQDITQTTHFFIFRKGLYLSSSMRLNHFTRRGSDQGRIKFWHRGNLIGYSVKHKGGSEAKCLCIRQS